MSSKKSRNRNRSIASNATDGVPYDHRVTESRREAKRVRRELHESIVTDAGVTEKKSTQIEKTESEHSNSESFQTHGVSQSDRKNQRTENLSAPSVDERASNVPDLDELADRIEATGYGGFGGGFGGSGSGGSGSEDGSSSSSCGDGPCPDEEEPCEGLTDKELFCCENPEADCCSEGGCTGGTCTVPEGNSEQPIRYFNGELRLSSSDLSASHLGGAMGHRRSYSNQMSRNHDYGNGFNWIVGQWGYLNEGGDGTITVVRGPGRNLWFELDGVGGYVGRFGAISTLTHDKVAGLLVLVTPTGEQFAYHDFDQFEHPPGVLAWHKDAGGQLTEVTAYTDNDHIAAIERSVDQDGQTITESLVYDYFGTGEQRVRLRHVTLRRKVGEGAWQDIQRAKYDYYGGGDSGGSLGDLRRAQQQEPAAGGTWQDKNIHYYRYYTTGDAKGFEHGLKYVLEPESYARLAETTDPLTASDAQLAQYADYHFEYNAARRVTKEIVQAGAMTFKFAYSVNNESGDRYNHWRRKTVETRPDGSQNIVFTNYIGQVLVKEFRSGAGESADRWIQSLRYNEDGRLAQRAQPSAVVDYDESANDLAVTLKTDAGLIHRTDYYASNGSGAAKGYVKSEKIKQGSAGTAILLRSMKYASHSVGGTTIYPVSHEIIYRNDDGTGKATTRYDYQYHAGSFQPLQRVTTLPVVPSGQNGDGATDTRTERFDIHGNRIWVRDERGTITHTTYDVVTGVATRQIVDVDTGQVSGVPAGWTTPAGGGLHLVTDYQYDDRGRITQSLGPVHLAEVGGVSRQVRRARWHVYLDVDHQQWTGQGYHDESTGSDTLVGPVSIVKRTRKGHLLEQISAVRSSASGKLTATDTFTQSDYVRWTTNQYSDCCTLISQRVYHTIPGSGEGSSGTNYDETQFGYDSLKRRNRTVTPGGTIRSMVFDVRGQQVAMYAGTDDTGATAGDPTGGGAVGNDMVLMSEQQYDSGTDGGDGLLTRTTQHVDDSTIRVTDYGHDWRNRRTVIDGELDFYQVDTHDNLGRVIQTERFDTNALGDLVSREKIKFDVRGRVYRRIRFAVDPATGSVTGSQNRDQTYDAGGNVVRMEPAGAMDYQTFTFDSLGRRIKETDPLNHSRSYGFDDAGNAITTTDQVGSTWTRRYDPIGRQVEVVNPLSEVMTYGYNDAGYQATVTNGAGETSTTSFDDAGRTISATDPLGEVTSYVYDANGNQTSVTDANGNTTTTAYDYLDRRVKVTDPAGHETKMAYNLAGEMIRQTDAKGNDTDHAYDALGRQSSVTDRLNHATAFAYTVLGQLESLTDAESQTTSYGYDGYGRQNRVTWPDHVPGSSPGDLGYGITTTEHDDLDRVTRTTDQLGDTVSMTYDVAGRLLKRDYRTRANSPSGTIADSDTFTFDDASRMLTATSGRYGNTVTYVYDITGRKLNETLAIGGQSYTTDTQYDAAGRVKKLIYPDASEVSRTYTARGQLEKIITGGVDLMTRGYDDGGRMTSSVYDNGVSESRSYNADNTSSAITFTGASIGNLSYTWDDNHNKASETIGGTMSGYGFTASYDAEDRLTGWDRSDASLDQSWNLTSVGDWQSFTENLVVQNRTHGPSHELTAAGGQSVQHDAKGNLTLLPSSLRPQATAFTWDFDNRLKSADVGNNGSIDVEYEFDALGRRVSRDDGTTTTVFVQNGQQTVADYVSGASPGSPEYTYLWGDYIDELIVRDGTGGRRFYHRNQQYSVISLTNSSGSITERYAYDAYGDLTITDASGTVRTTSSDDNRYTYTGREWDETIELYHFRARMYDPKAGRFIGRDPIGYEDGQNLYQAYFVPTMVDATGLAAGSCCESVLDDARSTGLIPATVQGTNGNVCKLNVFCKRGCPGGAPAYTTNPGANKPISICIDPRMSHEILEAILLHEVQHARDFCKGGWDTRRKDDCIKIETRGCNAQCSYMFPAKGDSYKRCMDCCVYFSCRRHRGVQQPNPPCDPANVPTRPCWKYDPKIPGFRPDPLDPRCPLNHRRK
ncbi:RHS repeat-associated core domain-containing protein [Rhodopirellula europaea]|uniref:RHS repeat-associated core domain-containing protein n=2 Tax=Rhodopirellula europaea TaxID=1263866 RepID=UPI003D2B774E